MTDDIANVKTGFVHIQGVYLENELKSFRLRSSSLTPVYEAFINSYESIMDSNICSSHKIEIILNVSTGSPPLKGMTTKPEYFFESIEVRDTGDGLTKQNLLRFLTLRDNRKGHANKGTGRVHYIRNFETTNVKSYVNISSEQSECIELELSKNPEYIRNNSFVKIIKHDIIESVKPSTSVTFTKPYNKKYEDYYANLSIDDLKNSIINHYLPLLCSAGLKCEIEIIRRVATDMGKPSEERVILCKEDIPTQFAQHDMVVNLSEINEGRVVNSREKTTLQISSFRTNLPDDSCYIANDKELGKKIQLDCLRKGLPKTSCAYIFIVKGDILNNSEYNESGEIKLLSAREYKDMQGELFNEKALTEENVIEKANETILNHYDDVKDALNKQIDELDEVTKFLRVDTTTRENVKKDLKLNDNYKTIISKVNKLQANKLSERDSRLFELRKIANDINPNSPTFREDVSALSAYLEKNTSLERMKELTRYVNRRRIILEILESIENKQHVLNKSKPSKKVRESVLHNLIFPQRSTNAKESDLWILNEEFIYFEGCSEHALKDIKYKGKKVLDIPESESNQFAMDPSMQRPDILLFPAEGKCIIIELKAPGVPVDDYLNQANKYANLIYSFHVPQMAINTFYTYLIGDDINPKDVRAYDSDFIYSPIGDYMYARPKAVSQLKDGGPENMGSIYREVISYRSLLERAKRRNQTFFEKLDLLENSSEEKTSDSL